LAGLANTERPGRPPVYDADDVILLVTTTTETPPEPASRWTMEALARRLNEAGVAISVSQVWRICQALDIKPWALRVADDQPRPRFLG
jgi:transposase